MAELAQLCLALAAYHASSILVGERLEVLKQGSQQGTQLHLKRSVKHLGCAVVQAKVTSLLAARGSHDSSGENHPSSEALIASNIDLSGCYAHEGKGGPRIGRELGL